MDVAAFAQPTPAIIAAAQNCDVGLLRRELDSGVSVDLEDFTGRTPLQAACKIETRPSRRDPLGLGPTEANEEGRTACVKLLIERGACVDAGLPNNPGRSTHEHTFYFTPLMYIALRNNPEVVKLLLSAGADANALIDVQPLFRHTPLANAVREYCRCSAGQVDAASLEEQRQCAFVVDALLKAGADPNGPKYDERSAIEWAIGISADLGYNTRPIWPILLRAGAIIPTESDHYDESEWATCLAHPYLQKIEAAGGWKAYEKAHRTKLLATFVPKFTHLVPPELVPLILEFSFHIGFY